MPDRILSVVDREPGLAEYHGAEHVSIGTYESGGTPAPKEHPRCGSQLIGPLMASSLAANVVASAAPRPARGLARLLGTTVALGASVELFAWMTRHPETIEADDSTGHAAALMIHGGFRHLPVLDQGRVAGIVSIRDLMRVALEDSSPRGV